MNDDRPDPATLHRRTGDPRPIGVFDSGVGGLTVARALMDLLPDERLVYFGDTARGPYGPRDLDVVRRFTAEIVQWLVAQDTKLVVAACNTATAAALEPSTSGPLGFDVPVVGVIRPAVDTAVRATRNGRVGVIGTVGTVESGAYDRAVAEVATDIKVFSQACPRFVELVERGRTTDPEVLEVAADYLGPMVAAGIDTLILGCTHYPLLTGVLTYVMGPGVVLVSSAEETARRVFVDLVDRKALAHGEPVRAGHRFVASGTPASFAELGARFLGPRLTAVDVEHGEPETAQRPRAGSGQQPPSASSAIMAPDRTAAGGRC
ncbi:MAG: glutamate racemase [Actinomycetota bacterium]|nr:glutamate racemase [Actinomycetota bacterium]